MMSRIWIVVAAAALVVSGTFAAISSIKKQREAKRMMIWG